MDETKFRLAGVRNFCNFVEQVDEICFRQTVRRNLLIMPVSHPLSLSLLSSLSTPSLSRWRGWSAAGRGVGALFGRRRGGRRALARGRPCAAAERGRRAALPAAGVVASCGRCAVRLRATGECPVVRRFYRANLSIRFLHQKVRSQHGHVESSSRPSDRQDGGVGSSKPRSFCKKVLKF